MSRGMDYSNVKNAHVVPRVYLELWAVDGKIGVVQVEEKKHLELAVEKVGTRRRFYRRTRPDGSDIDDIEWTLCEMEANAAPLLQSFDEAWPFSGQDKRKLAVLFTFQLLRTPRWREEHADRIRGLVDAYVREPRSCTSDGSFAWGS